MGPRSGERQEAGAVWANRQGYLFNGAGGTMSLGTACFCLPSNNSVSPGACPCPTTFPMGKVSKALSAGAAGNVCVHRSPADPRAPASLTLNFPVGYFSMTGIVFDPALGTSAGKTNVIFASSYGHGVYESTNGGASWSLIGGPKIGRASCRERVYVLV